MNKEEFEKLLADYQKGNRKTNWFQENIAGLIAVAFTIFTFAIYVIILVRAIKTTETTTTVILTSVTNMEMLILGFYFVSSKSNKDKDKMINDIQESVKTIEANKT